MADLQRVTALAQKLLTVAGDGDRGDPWVWQHSARVARLARLIALLPEVSAARLDADALAVACLFHDAGWIAQLQSGRVDRWQLLSRPTSDIQRELGAAFLREHAGHMLRSPTLDTAAEAIRRCNMREPGMLEAKILAEAENLDDVGLIHMLRQFRLQQAEGRSLEQLISVWRRQKEYQYWDARIEDSFRFESIKQLARTRLAAMDRLMAAMEAEEQAADLKRLIEAFGVDLSGVEA